MLWREEGLFRFKHPQSVLLVEAAEPGVGSALLTPLLIWEELHRSFVCPHGTQERHLGTRTGTVGFTPQLHPSCRAHSRRGPSWNPMGIGSNDLL